MNMRILRPLLFLLSLGSTIVASAQEDDGLPTLSDERMQEIKAQKAAFITQRLGLTPEQAQTFWPVYNQYDQELDRIRKDMRAERRGVRGNTALSEAEAAKALDNELASRQRELDIRKRYVGEFKKTIGAVKTLQLARAELDFNRELLKRVRGRGGERRSGPRP
jgi:Skp family chaperone for outer membrane proteins